MGLMTKSKVFLAMEDLTHEPTLPLPHAAKDLLLFFRLLYNVRPSEPPSAADCITIMKLIHQYDCTSLALDSFFKEDFFDKAKLDSLLDYKAGRLKKLNIACCQSGKNNVRSLSYINSPNCPWCGCASWRSLPSFEQISGDVNPRSCKKLLTKAYESWLPK